MESAKINEIANSLVSEFERISIERDAALKNSKDQEHKLNDLTESVKILTEQTQKKMIQELELPPPPEEEPQQQQKDDFLDLPIEKQIELLNKLLRVMRGQEDPRTHVTVITNPSLDHLLSSSRLTEKQVKAIVNCKLAYQLRPEFKPLADFADTILRAEISGDSGWGTTQGIHLAEAYAPRIASIERTEVSETKQHWYSKPPKGDKDKSG